ncbi:hypothetical protein L873DRAFT_1796546, partial [Choiromyces venosus 120613-1]
MFRIKVSSSFEFFECSFALLEYRSVVFFEYKSVVVSVVVSHFLNIKLDELSIPTKYLFNIKKVVVSEVTIHYFNIVADVLNSKAVGAIVVTLNLLNGVFTNFLNIIENHLYIICPKYLQIFLNGIKLVVVADVTENLLNSKQEVFTTLLNSNSLGVSIVTPNLLNISSSMSSSFTFLQYNNKSFGNYSESFEYQKYLQIFGIEDFKYKLEVFTNILNITPYLLNVTLNLLNMTANLLNSNLRVFINLWNVSSNCKYFQYNPEVFKNVLNIVSVVTANLLNKYYTTSSLRSSCKYFEYYCKSFEYNSKSSEYESQVISVLTANIWNGNSEVFEYVLNKSSGSNSFALIKYNSIFFQ